MDNYNNCPVRHWFDRHDDGSGQLPTDPVPAEVSSAIHDALMNYHRDVEGVFLSGRRLDDQAAVSAINRHVKRALFEHRVDASIPAVVDRLKKATTGIERIAVSIANEIDSWVQNGNDLLVWTEASLDHGPKVRAVELHESVLVPTRPDVIGIRRLGGGINRVVVRDYKAKSAIVDPAFDTGILVRALWAISELQNPRCRWFLAGRDLPLEHDIVDLETVNLMHSGSEDFIVRRLMPASMLVEHRDRLIDLAREMAEADACEEASQVPASPDHLCFNWCSHLHRCTVGQAHVRKYHGEEALTERLSVL